MNTSADSRSAIVGRMLDKFQSDMQKVLDANEEGLRAVVFADGVQLTVKVIEIKTGRAKVCVMPLPAEYVEMLRPEKKSRARHRPRKSAN